MINPSEYRRVYMKRLVADIQQHLRVPTKEARLIAAGMVAIMQVKMNSGKPIDLGFINIIPVTMPPREFRFNMNTLNKGRTFVGESTKWQVKFRKSWLKRHRPRWSTKY